MYNPTLRLVKQDELTWQELDDNFEQLVGEFTRVDLKNAEQDVNILALQGAAGVTTLQDLTDVNVTGAVNGMVLYFDGTNWVANYPVSSGGGGTTLPTGTANGEQLIWDTSINDWQIGVGGSTLPTGTANGDILYWDSGTNSWSATAAGSGASVSIGGTAPASPSNGDLWYDDGSINASAGLYVWDATAGAWIDSTGSGGGGTTLPTGTANGEQLVWNTSTSAWEVGSGGGGTTLPTGTANGEQLIWNTSTSAWEIGAADTALPTATNDWDMLVWDSTNSQWVVTDAIDAGTF